MKKTLTNIAGTIWTFLIWLVSVIAILIDRIIMTLVIWRDLPSMQMIDEFDHEKERLAKRWAVYIALSILFFLYYFGVKIVKLVSQII